jgi:hypothetical protein
MLIPAQNSNKANYKIQDYFANRQIKEDVKYNKELSDNSEILKNIFYNGFLTKDVVKTINHNINFSLSPI